MNSCKSFVFTIDRKTIMTAQIALKQCLEICGFTTQNDRNKIVINKGINSLQDNGLLTDKEIVLMACDTLGRRTEATRLVFGIMRIKKFFAIGFWVRDRNRRNLVLDADVFTFMDLQTMIHTMHAKKDLMESTYRGDIEIPKFSGGVYFPCWVDDICNALRARIVVSGIPLDYIIQAIMAPGDFINDTERVHFDTAHVGDHFQRDNVELF